MPVSEDAAAVVAAIAQNTASDDALRTALTENPGLHSEQLRQAIADHAAASYAGQDRFTQRLETALYTIYRQLADSFPPNPFGLDPVGMAMATYVAPGLQDIENAITGALARTIADVFQGLPQAISILGGQMGAWQAYGISVHTPDLVAALVGGPGQPGLLNWHGPVTVDAGQGWAAIAQALKPGTINISGDLGGGGAAGAVLGGLGFFGGGSQLIEDMLKNKPGAGSTDISTEGRSVTARVQGWISNLFGFADATPENALSNCAQGYLDTSILGLTAAGVAALAGSIGMGTGPIGLANLSAILGDMAGYKPVTQSIVGAIADTYLGVPMGLYARKAGRPTLPGPGDAKGLYWRRKLSDSPGAHPATVPSRSARDLMAFAGYPDEWIDSILADADRDASVREIGGCIAQEGWDDSTVTSRLRELGYGEDLIPSMVKYVRYRGLTAGLNDFAGEKLKQLERGYSLPEDTLQALTDAGYPEPLAKLRVQASEQAAWTRATDKQVDLALDRYDRAMMTDAELSFWLEAYIVDPYLCSLVVNSAQVLRYRKVPLLGQYDKAKELRGETRQSYILGLVYWPQYERLLEDLGWDDGMRNVEHALVENLRTRQMSSDVKAWLAPNWREQVVLGLLPPGTYEGRLKAQGMRDDWAKAEAELAASLHTRYLEGRAQRWQLPAVERAYVYDLIARGTVTAIYTEAGLQPPEQRDKLRLLDFQRQLELARNQAEKRRLSVQLGKEAAKEKKNIQAQAARAAAAIVKAQLALLKSKDPAVADALPVFLPFLDEAYAAVHAVMPDRVYELQLALKDAAADPRGPDLEAIATLADDLVAALEAEAVESSEKPTA